MKKNSFFNVGICDDESEWCRALFETCSRLIVSKNFDMKIFSYSNGESLFSDKDKELDILFLDVEMESMDGLTIMKTVEKMPNIHNIVFVSSHSEAVWDAFGSKTQGFITKPFTDDDIWEKIESIYSKKLSDGIVQFHDTNGVVFLKKSEIIYLHADSNYVDIHSKNGEKTVTCNLKESERQLGGLPFVRIHKSYIVNLDHVSNISSSLVFLENGETCTIGRSYREQVKNIYQDYLLKELHR